MHVVDDIGQGEIVGQHHPRWRKILLTDLDSASVVGEFHDGPHEFLGDDHIDSHDRLTELGDLTRVGHFLGAVDFQYLPGVRQDLVGHVRRGLHEVDVAFIF